MDQPDVDKMPQSQLLDTLAKIADSQENKGFIDDICKQILNPNSHTNKVNGAYQQILDKLQRLNIIDNVKQYIDEYTQNITDCIREIEKNKPSNVTAESLLQINTDYQYQVNEIIDKFKNKLKDMNMKSNWGLTDDEINTLAIVPFYDIYKNNRTINGGGGLFNAACFFCWVRCDGFGGCGYIIGSPWYSWNRWCHTSGCGYYVGGN